MLLEGGSIHWFPCLQQRRQGNQICSRRDGSIFEFLPGKSKSDWLSLGRKFKSAPVPARANPCMLPPRGRILKAPAGREHTWCVPGMGSPGHRAWPWGMGSPRTMLAREGGCEIGRETGRERW